MKSGVQILFLIVILAGCGTQNQQEVRVLKETHSIEKFQFSSSYVDEREVKVYMPPYYDETKNYPVIYMHDGQMLFDSTTTWNGQEWQLDETLDRLIGSGKIKPAIVVGIDNGGAKRRAEYFPEKPFLLLDSEFRDSLYHFEHYGSPFFGDSVKSDDYLLFIVKELKPFIDSGFSTASTKENTFIGGSSYGGLISLYGICEYPDVFGGAFCMSTHWTGIFTNDDNPIPGTFISYFNEKLRQSDQLLYMDRGTETLDSLYEPHQLQFDSILGADSVLELRWLSKVYVGAGHDERSWSQRLHVPLSYILRSQ